MKKLTEQRAITLIALIITIIVMLILVAVTINVALNGGLFQKAKSAATGTEQKAIYEQIVGGMELDNNGNINVATTKSNASTLLTAEGKGVTQESWGLKVVGKSGTYYYSITTEEIKILDKEPQSEVEESLEKYILGDNLEGLPATDLLNQSYQFTNSDVTFANGSYQNSIAVVGNNVAHLYIKYKNDGKIYGVKMTFTTENNPATYSTIPEDGINKIKIIAGGENSYVGKTATINGEKYIVLYDAGEQGSNVQLISANVYETGNVTLGYNDSQITWANATGANIFADTSNHNDSEATLESKLTDVEKGIYSYNNAIANLNAKCASVVGNSNNDIKDVRSVGSNPVSKNSETSTTYSSTFLTNNPSGSQTYSAGDFNGIGKDTDTNYIKDYDRMIALGIVQSENKDAGNSNSSYIYWLASRGVIENSDYVNFYVRCVRSDGGCSGNGLWYVYASSASGFNGSYGVRPIVSLSSSALQNYLNQ